ncbi:MAG: prephenate dehydratase [Bacteriovoracaceae bacterium]
MKIAIQGVKASFHDVAAKVYFHPPFEVIECNSFPKLFESLASKEADFAIMAIENALAGSILPNYALMEKYHFKILGEVFLKIEMSLMALPGEKLEDIKVVQSHPMALLQCQDFLSTLPNVKLVEHADTAESALEIKQKNLKGHAAIASSLAASTHGLELLKVGIESNKLNYTRFLVLSRQENTMQPLDCNKTTLSFEAQHSPGSLVKILNIFEKYGLNMTKIQSLPIIGRPYQYAFHVDLEWSDEKNHQEALLELNEKALKLTHFGDYKAGRRPNL